MKILVMSDSHGAYPVLQRVFEKYGEADLLIHLGDGEREVSRLVQTHPELEKKLYYLKGNCDTGHLVFPTLPSLTLTLPFGHRIFAAHGDYYRVKYGTSRIKYEAESRKADIVLYGHTHVGECRYEDGIYIINPGSLSCPRDGKKPGFVLLDVCKSGILPNTVYL